MRTTGRVARAIDKMGVYFGILDQRGIIGGIDLISRNLSNDSVRYLESLSDFFLYKKENQF
jgi:hypothetical protein